MISLYIFFFYIIIYPVKSVFNVYSLCLILAVINLTAFKKNKLKKISLTYPEIYFLICYIFFPVISNLYSINHYRTVLGIFDNFSYLLLLIALRRFFIPADQKAFFLFIAKSVLIICVYGLFKKNFFSERLTSTYLNPNLLADAIGFSLVFLIIFYKKNIGGALMSAFLIVFLFLTKSLGTVLSLTIVFFALLLFFGTKRFGISKKKIAVMILFLFGLSCLAGYSRYNRTRNDVFGNLRLNIINSSVKSLSESPLIGTGHNTYESKIIRYVFPAIKSDLKYVKKQQNPHNFFLHIANETGIINLSIFFVMICILVSETIVNPSKIKTLGISGILLILVHHSADVGYDVPIIQYFLVLFIWCVSSEMKPAFSVIIRGRLKIILFAGFVILFILMPGLNLYSEIIAETGRKYFDENNFEKAAEKFEKSLIFVSDNGEILQKLAECYEKKFYKTGNLEYKAKSIEFFKKGSEAEPDNGFF
ncbi:MAG TPA: O-antigen ligase family protein, partial [bacterium]|nr:O-antigen ligase family protein [bacterium]